MKLDHTQPLLYDCREFVTGAGFAAVVTCAGSALVESEDGETTILSVNPGGFSGCGESFYASYADLTRNLQEILWDLASMAGSFEEFSSLAKRHLSPARPELLDEWTQATKRARRSHESELELPTTKTYSERGIHISRVQIEDLDERLDGPLAEPVIATRAA